MKNFWLALFLILTSVYTIVKELVIIVLVALSFAYWILRGVYRFFEPSFQAYWHYIALMALVPAPLS